MESNPTFERNPGFWSKTSWIQLGYGIWVSLTALGVGFIFEFPAVQIPQLIDPHSKIHVNVTQESWIASVLTILAPFGCLVGGYLMDKYGRRFAMVLCQMPMAIGWLYMSFAETPRDIIIGRVISGIGCGMAFGAPRVYLTEVTLPKMRGVVGSFPNIALPVGITILAALGSFLEWHVLCYICSGFTACLMGLNYFLPETPHYLLMKDSEENAKKCLIKFRSKKYDINAEMANLMEFKATSNIRNLPLKEQFKALLTPSSCKPLGIIAMYLIFMQGSGVGLMVVRTIEMMEESKSTVDAHMGNFLLGVTRIIVNIGNAYLLFVLGRKTLALASALGVGVFSVILGFYIHYAQTPTVFPQICYMAYIIFASLGYYGLPFLIMCELYPLQVRGLLGGITVAFFNVLIFITNFSYSYVKGGVGLANTILLFGTISLIGFVYLLFYLPETKDLTLQEIEEFFKQRRPTLVSQRRPKLEQQRESSSGPGGHSKSDTNIKPDNNKSKRKEI